ncbi:hypothetical protein HPB47_026523 [Ixodes persulcatus]|uniref:Uncharacterized protein n=1 Tax=Ixodes persulcatus TaxID=34615 RepID=A0AC60PYM0_IXOPE|nr:hypothetical protein HPB47_026523 [Ixodes persulcatus]
MSSIDKVIALLGYKPNLKLGDLNFRFRKDRHPANTAANPWSPIKMQQHLRFPKTEPVLLEHLDSVFPTFSREPPPDCTSPDHSDLPDSYATYSPSRHEGFKKLGQQGQLSGAHECSLYKTLQRGTSGGTEVPISPRFHCCKGNLNPVMFTMLLKKIAEVFGRPAVRKLTAERKLATRVQQSEETFTVYIEDVSKMTRRVDSDMPEKKRVRHTLKGISEDAFQLLATQNALIVEKAIEA